MGTSTPVTKHQDDDNSSGSDTVLSQKYSCEATSQLAFLSRMLVLEHTIGQFLQANPQKNAKYGLSPSECVSIKEDCDVLESIREVKTRLQGC